MKILKMHKYKMWIWRTQFFSTVNYRCFPRQLTTAGLGNHRQLNAEEQFRLLHMILSLQMCEQQFSFRLALNPIA